jgi:hypothetical protein
MITNNEGSKMMIRFKSDISKFDPIIVINDKFINIFYKSSTISKNYFEFDEIIENCSIKKEISDITVDVNTSHYNMNNNNLNISLNFLSNNEENQNQLEDLSKEYFTDNASTNEIMGII